MKNKILLTLLLALALSAIYLFVRPGTTPEPTVNRISWVTMGTVAGLQYQGDADPAPLLNRIKEVYNEVNRCFSAWETNSMLNRVNARAGEKAVPVSPSFLSLLTRTLAFSESSGGAFNPLAGPFIHAWGFNTWKKVPETVPDEKLLASLKPLTRWDSVTLETAPPSVRLPIRGMFLDLGGIAKGYAVDRAWEEARKQGARNILIDLGGNLRALGEAAPGRKGWRTAVRNPFKRYDTLSHFLLKSGEAVATSGNYERFVTIGGRRYAHIIDARTGRPVSGVASATVLAPTAEQADALSTLLFILGPEEGYRFLQKHGQGCEAIWIPDTPQTPTLIVTPGFGERLSAPPENWIQRQI